MVKRALEQAKTFRCSSPHASWLHLATIGLAVLLGLGVAAGAPIPLRWGVLVLIALTLLYRVLQRIDVDLGPEGVTIRKRIGWSRFIAWTQIVSAQEHQRQGAGSSRREGETATWTIWTGVRFELEDGTHLDVGTGSQEVPAEGNFLIGSEGWFGARDEIGRELVRSVRRRLEEIAKHDRQPEPLEDRLARRGRTIEEWQLDLGRIASTKPGDYREAAPEKERLWNILEDPAADPSARAAAAMVLREQISAEERPRVRLAVDRCASPPLRSALRGALTEEETDEEERWRALEKLE